MKPKKYTFATFKKEVGGLKFGKGRRYDRYETAFDGEIQYEATLRKRRLNQHEYELVIYARVDSSGCIFTAVLNVQISSLFCNSLRVWTEKKNTSLADVLEELSTNMQEVLTRYGKESSVLSSNFNEHVAALKGKPYQSSEDRDESIELSNSETRVRSGLSSRKQEMIRHGEMMNALPGKRHFNPNLPQEVFKEQVLRYFPNGEGVKWTFSSLGEAGASQGRNFLKIEEHFCTCFKINCTCQNKFSLQKVEFIGGKNHRDVNVWVDEQWILFAPTLKELRLRFQNRKDLIRRRKKTELGPTIRFGHWTG